MQKKEKQILLIQQLTTKIRKKIGLANKYNLKIITKLPNIPKATVNVEEWVINKIKDSCKKLKTNRL